MGFIINPYDPCVAKKLINGSQLTATWHVDNLKVFYKDAKVVTSFILDFQKMYGDDGLTVKRGKIHSYLRIDFDYSTDGQLKVSMIKYAGQILDDFPKMITSTHSSPAVEQLFKIREESERKLLPEEQARHFHHPVTQLLLLSMRT